jgi:hypothetical protein
MTITDRRTWFIGNPTTPAIPLMGHPALRDSVSLTGSSWLPVKRLILFSASSDVELG